MKKSRPDFTGLLLVSDMDGTLLNSRNQVSLENLVAIERFVSFGGRFTVATGRIPSIAAPIVTHIVDEFPEAGIEVYYNGAAYCVQENAVTDKHREIDGIEIISVSDIGLIPKPWQKVLITGNPDLLADMEIILHSVNNHFICR